MSIYRTVLLPLCSMALAMGTEPAAPAENPLPGMMDSIAYLLEEDEQKDSLLLTLSRAAHNMPSATRAQLLDPVIKELLRLGHDPLEENEQGCNAVFYLAGIPELYRQLTAEDLLPRELALRIPHDEGALLRYMRLRNNQANLARAAGSHEYLVRRYCAPAYARAERLLRSYMGATSLTRLPHEAMTDCLSFMMLANPRAAQNYINSLTYWEHGEHFLEEIPAHLLATLHQLEWSVDPVQLRRALDKLGTLLPESKDDMIECAASVPMARILEMLTRMEGSGAMPELEKYAAAFDPEIVHSALLLQMKLLGIPRPGDEAFKNITIPEIAEVREALAVDEAIRKGHMEQLNAARLIQAAGVLRKHQMPHHAEMMAGIVENDQIVLRPELRPAFRTRYEELREASPHVVLLRYLIGHKELLSPGEEAQS